MPEYYFERECRTPYSESFLITKGGDAIGRVDLHYTPTVVHATLCVINDVTMQSIQDLIEVIDEDLVMSADVDREDFIVNVYQGRDMGVYSDEEFEGEEEGNGHHL